MSNTPVILIHGALGTALQMKPLANRLEVEFDTFVMELPGHGQMPMGDTLPTILDFVTYLENLQLPQAHFVGYSMGGYIALLYAARNPDKVLKVCTIGTKYNWNPEIATREVSMLDPEKMKAKIPAFYHFLEQQHECLPLPEVLALTAHVLTDLGHTSPLSKVTHHIQNKALIIRGALDRMVQAAESEQLATDLPNAQYLEIEHMEHAAEKWPLDALGATIGDFLKA